MGSILLSKLSFSSQTVLEPVNLKNLILVSEFYATPPPQLPPLYIPNLARKSYRSGQETLMPFLKMYILMFIFSSQLLIRALPPYR